MGSGYEFIKLSEQDENLRRKEKEARRQRRKEIKRIVRAQEKKVRLGGHDRTGTRVRDSTPLPPPRQSAADEAVPASQDTRSSGPASGVAPLQPASTLGAQSHGGMMSQSSAGTDGTPSAAASAGGSVAEARLPQAPEQERPCRPDLLSPKSTNTKTPTKTPRKGRKIKKNQNQVLGRGAFGTVYMGLDSITGELVAVKEILFAEGEQVRQQIHQIAKEISLMKRLQHENIVRYLGAERKHAMLHIYMEYVPGGSLRSIIDRFGSLAERVARRFLRQMLAGLEYLHGEGVAHLDIKNDNALLGVTGEVKLADFGASEKLEEIATGNVVGTPYFMAPEVVKGAGASSASDIWSLGISAIELLTGRPPHWDIRDPYAVMFRIASSDGPPELPQWLRPDARAFLDSCLTLNPWRRAKASELLQADWFCGEEESDDDDAEEPPAPEPRPPRPSASPSPTEERRCSFAPQQMCDRKAANSCPRQPAWDITSQSGSTSYGGSRSLRTGGSHSDAHTSVTEAAGRQRRSLCAAATDARASVSRGSLFGALSPPQPAPEGFGNLNVMRSFVSGQCERSTLNTKGDMHFLNSLARQRGKGLLTSFEFQAKQGQLLALGSEPPADDMLVTSAESVGAGA
eukprot:TRINITY_DN9484_c0_g1_i1.p1 TRINITY_DN9484_c0_g1~~TRINITY_DN9484_c0_g1_i1.p1  ORF type:complete len:629 (+),score=162.14 TRINITY_DN9484_c0_g1_i1:104-1990(+)